MKLNIVTVHFNSGDQLEATFNSLKEFLSNQVVWIILDGNSSDNSLSFLEDVDKKYLTHVRCIREPDDGIYNAMNKAISILDSEEFIWFLNAGDLMHSLPCSNCLIKDVNFFAVKTNYNSKEVYPNITLPFALKTLSPYSTFPHQGMVTKAAVLKRYKFDEKIGLCADHLQIVRILKDEQISVSKKVIAIYDTNGLSNTRHIEMLRCNCRVCRSLDFSVFRYLLINHTYVLKQITKSVLPRALFRLVRNLI